MKAKNRAPFYQVQAIAQLVKFPNWQDYKPNQQAELERALTGWMAQKNIKPNDHSLDLGD